MAIGPIYKLGNVVLDDATKIVVLASSLGTTSGKYGTLRDVAATNAGTSYQVPSLKTLNIIQCILSGSVAGNFIDMIGYGDTAVTDSVSAPTNPLGNNFRYTCPANASVILPLNIAIPAGKYPFSIGNFTGIYNVIFQCVLV